MFTKKAVKTAFAVIISGLALIGGFRLLSSRNLAIKLCPHGAVTRTGNIAICQETAALAPGSDDPVLQATTAITRVTAWDLSAGKAPAQLWTKEVPSPAGGLFSTGRHMPGYLRMPKPVQSAFPGNRYYALESGRFVLVSTIRPEGEIVYQESGDKLPIPRLAGVEVWATFLQPAEMEALTPEGRADPLENRITYASASGPIAVLGLRCKRGPSGSVEKFDTLRPRLSLTGEGAPPAGAPSGTPPPFRITVRYFSPMLGEQDQERAVLNIPVSGDEPDLQHAQVPEGCSLARLAISETGEDLKYNDAHDRDLLKNSLQIKKLRINNTENTQILSRIGQFGNLEELDISCLESLEKLPGEIGTLKHLKTLRIDNGNGCSMDPELPESLGELTQLKTLVLYGAQDSSDGGIKRTLPKSLSKLVNLETLDIGRNQYGVFPPEVLSLPALKVLDLSYDSLKELPDSLNTLPKLSKVILNGNYDITCSQAKRADISKRFPRVTFDFSNEYDCPEPGK